MFRIKTLNKIASVGLAQLDKGRFVVEDDCTNPDGILVRSAKMHDYEFPEALRAIARAGAGTNNIPLDRCSEAGIVVFNSPGANANAVKEEVIFAMLAASRHMFEANEWAKREAASGADVLTTMEKAKSQFAGPEIFGKTLGIIGLGAIGAKVADAALGLGMNIVGYDPYLSVHAALSLDRRVDVVSNLDDLLKVSDYITIHVPLNDSTRNTIDAAAIAKMKGDVRIINLARNGLVDEEALIPALESGRVAAYVTDFPDNRIANAAGVIALPHLGRVHPGERGQLRDHGRPRASGLSGERQHHQLRQYACRQYGALRRGPDLRDPPQHPQHAGADHLHRVRRGHERGESGQQVPQGLRLHHAGCERQGGRRHGRADQGHRGRHPRAGDAALKEVLEKGFARCAGGTLFCEGMAPGGYLDSLREKSAPSGREEKRGGSEFRLFS